MKRLLMLVAMFALAAPAAYAGNASGCGLGYTLFKGQTGMVPNVLAVTTNGTSGNQTFGITSGTSGCDAGDVVYNEAQQEAFVAVNYEKLSQEMAQGNGAYVTALAELMGCDTTAHVRFGHVSQAGYERLFPGVEADAQALLTGLKQEIANDAALAGGCMRIS